MEKKKKVVIQSAPVDLLRQTFRYNALSGAAKRLTLCSFSSRTVEGGGERQPVEFSCVIADVRPGQSLACKI